MAVAELLVIDLVYDLFSDKLGISSAAAARNYFKFFLEIGATVVVSAERWSEECSEISRVKSCRRFSTEVLSGLSDSLRCLFRVVAAVRCRFREEHCLMSSDLGRFWEANGVVEV